MKSLSFAALALLTYTTQIFCAADSSSSPVEKTLQQAWTTDPVLASTIAYNIGADYNLCAYHKKSSEHIMYPWREDECEQFGFALVPTTKPVKPLRVNEEAFLAAQTAAYNFFQITENSILTSPVLATTAVAYAFSNPHKARKYLLLCSDEKIENKIIAELEAHPDWMLTFEDAVRHVRVKLPSSTFVLFDVATYCAKVLSISYKGTTSQTCITHRRTKSA